MEYTVKVNYGPRSQYTREATVKVGSAVRLYDGFTGTVEGFACKDGMVTVSLTGDRWAYLTQIEMVY